jgi:riboflavin kinase/FMN adenylyltransferase
MQILRGLYSNDTRAVAVTVGNFDGVHLGHQALLEELRVAAQPRGLQTAVVIFEPHPREFFTPQQAPARLTSLREKLELFSTMGVDRVHICRFDAQFAQKTANDFIHALHEKLHAKFVLIGDDFRFGSGRAGDFALVQKIGAERAFEVAAVHSVLHDGVRISSTAIRTALASGQIRMAKEYLGRPYSISGRVVHGNGLGARKLVSTANIQLKHNRPPLSGILWCAQCDGCRRCRAWRASACARRCIRTASRCWKCMCSIFKPDLQQAHASGFPAQAARRGKYPDVETLTRQIALDVENAKQWFIDHE